MSTDGAAHLAPDKADRAGGQFCGLAGDVLPARPQFPRAPGETSSPYESATSSCSVAPGPLELLAVHDDGELEVGDEPEVPRVTHQLVHDRLHQPGPHDGHVVEQVVGVHDRLDVEGQVDRVLDLQPDPLGVGPSRLGVIDHRALGQRHLPGAEHDLGAPREHQRPRLVVVVLRLRPHAREEQREVVGVETAPVPALDDARHVADAPVVVVVAATGHLDGLAVQGDPAGDRGSRGGDDPAEEVGLAVLRGAVARHPRRCLVGEGQVEGEVALDGVQVVHREVTTEVGVGAVRPDPDLAALHRRLEGGLRVVLDHLLAGAVGVVDEQLDDRLATGAFFGTTLLQERDDGVAGVEAGVEVPVLEGPLAVVRVQSVVARGDLGQVGVLAAGSVPAFDGGDGHGVSWVRGKVGSAT